MVVRREPSGRISFSQVTAWIIGAITVISLIWGISKEYAMQTEIEPLKIRVAALEVSHAAIQAQLSHLQESSARQDVKLDLIFDSVRVGSGNNGK